MISFCTVFIFHTQLSPAERLSRSMATQSDDDVDLVEEDKHVTGQSSVEPRSSEGSSPLGLWGGVMDRGVVEDGPYDDGSIIRLAVPGSLIAGTTSTAVRGSECLDAFATVTSIYLIASRWFSSRIHPNTLVFHALDEKKRVWSFIEFRHYQYRKRK